MKYRIRKACEDDIRAVIRIEQETSPEPWSEASLAEDICHSGIAYVAVAEDGSGRIFGYSDMWLVAGEAQLNNIAVTEEMRGCGWGERLLHHMMDTGCAKGCSEMILEVRSRNTAARALYAKAGFMETGIRRGYYLDDGDDAVIMSAVICSQGSGM